MRFVPIATTEESLLPRQGRRRRGDWRNADLRGRPEERPQSVGGVVAGTHRALRWARQAEALLIALGSTAGLVALATFSSARPGDPETLTVAFLGGAFAGLGWWWEHRRDRWAVARELDRRLRHQGALVTAFGLEQREEPLAPVESWLRATVLDRLRPREARRAMLPSLILPVAVPVGGVLVLALALERVREPGGPDRDLSEVTGGMVEAVAGLGSGALAAGDQGRLSSEEVGEMLALRNRIRALDRRAERLGEDPEAAAEIESLDRDLARTAARLGAEPDLRRDLQEARTWLDALRMGLDGPQSPPLEANGEDGNRDPAASVTGGATDGTMGGSTEGSGALSVGDTDGAAAALPRGPSAAAPTASHGLHRARWWPAEYDAIVQRYAAPAAGDSPDRPPPTDRERAD